MTIRGFPMRENRESTRDPLDGIAEDDPLESIAVPEGSEEGGGLPALPQGHRETGRRVLVAPAVDIVAGEQPGTERTRGEFTEYREIEREPPRPPPERGLFETAADFASDPGGFLTRVAVGAERPPSIAGRELPSPQSLARALRSRAPLTDRLDVLLPIAARPEGMRAQDPDRRHEAGARAAFDTLALGWLDELGEMREEGTGEQMRRASRESAEQAPGMAALGEAAGSVPMLAIPAGQGTVGARITAAGLTGLGTGALRGAGESEAESPVDVAHDALGQSLLEGTTSAAGQGIAEGAGPLIRRLASTVENRIPRLTRDAAQHGLEARGIWAQRAANLVHQRPGGPQQLVRELDDIGAPLHPRDAREFAQRTLAEEGPRLGATARAMDEGGHRVDLEPVILRLDDLAREQDEFPITGEAPAAALRGRAQSLTELPSAEFGGGGDVAPSMGFQQAHGQRMELDDQINWNNPDPSIASLQGQRAEIRRALSDTMQSAADRAGLGDTWRSANQRYALAAELDDLSGGPARQGGQGGLAGAESRAAGFGRFIHGPGVLPRLQGAIEMTAGPAAMQEIRHAYPGIAYRTMRALIPRLRTMGPSLARVADRLDRAAQRGPGTLAAQHFLLMQRDPEYRRAYERSREEE